MVDWPGHLYAAQVEKYLAQNMVDWLGRWWEVVVRSLASLTRAPLPIALAIVRVSGRHSSWVLSEEVRWEEPARIDLAEHRGIEVEEEDRLVVLHLRCRDASLSVSPLAGRAHGYADVLVSLPRSPIRNTFWISCSFLWDGLIPALLGRRACVVPAFQPCGIFLDHPHPNPNHSIFGSLTSYVVGRTLRFQSRSRCISWSSSWVCSYDHLNRIHSTFWRISSLATACRPPLTRTRDISYWTSSSPFEGEIWHGCLENNLCGPWMCCVPCRRATWTDHAVGPELST